MGYIVHLDRIGVDLIPNANDVTVKDGVLFIGQGSNILATYPQGTWTAVREDGEVTTVDDEEAFLVSIESLKESVK